MIDTHAHLYLSQFDNDREDVVNNAAGSGVAKILLPAIDKSSFVKMMSCVSAFPGKCYPMIGLHPVSVNKSYREEIEFISEKIQQHSFLAVGECGIDMYWDTTYIKEQEHALRLQIELSLKHSLPLVLHSRKSLGMLIEIIREYKSEGLKGVFHCFPGNIMEAETVTQELGFYLGIGGVVTYKNSAMAEVVKEIPLEHILLETDSPYLSPEPCRGKRNECGNLNFISKKIASLKNIHTYEVERVTDNNAETLFKIITSY